jgi:putative membrane protein
VLLHHSVALEGRQLRADRVVGECELGRQLFDGVVLSAALAAFARPTPPPLDDPTIVAIFDGANTFDIETGELALKRSHTAAVRDLATQFIHDHSAVRQQGRDLAKKLGVTPTPPAEFALADAHKKVVAELRAKSGADFDKVYADHEVAYHQAVIDAIDKTLLPAIQNAELKAFVPEGRAGIPRPPRGGQAAAEKAGI